MFQSKLGEQVQYSKKKKRKYPVSPVLQTLTGEQVAKMKTKPKPSERFDLIIPGVNVKEIERFYQIFQQSGLKKQSQVFRLILYRYDEKLMKHDQDP